MKKPPRPITPRPLELKKETLIRLTDDQLKGIAGANTTGKKSQCVTLCFT
jgi:hypothetical protein